MENDDLIRIDLICSCYDVEPEFIESAIENGLIEVTTIDNTRFVQSKMINHFEKIIHMHYDLDINLEGIETITYLLERMRELQDEINDLKNRLRFFDEPFRELD